MKSHWWQIALLAFVVEFIYGIFIVVVLGDGAQAFSVTGLISAVILFTLSGWWVGFKAEQNKVLRGAMVGIIAVVIYNLLNIGAYFGGASEEPLSTLVQLHYLGHHMLKIFSAACGAWIAVRMGQSKELADL